VQKNRTLLGGVGILILAAVWYFGYLRFKIVADTMTGMPIGTSRRQIDAFIHEHEVQVAGFDYEGGDPRQGRLIRAEYRGKHFSFVFDKAGPEGKMIQKRVTETSHPALLGPPGEP
jgi:hypothetical protein